MPRLAALFPAVRTGDCGAEDSLADAAVFLLRGPLVGWRRRQVHVALGAITP